MRLAVSSHTRLRHCCAARRRLPNGLDVETVSSADVAFIYDEVFNQRCYSPPGYLLPAGGLVVDVGANIGLFSLWAAQQIAPGGTLLACEPAPACVTVLKRNLARHAPGVDARVLPLALGSAAGQAQLTFYSRLTGWSSLKPDDAEVARNVCAFSRASLSDALGSLFAPLRRAAPFLERLRGSRQPAGVAGWLARISSAVYAFLFNVVLTVLRSGAETHIVRVVTLSQLLSDEHLLHRPIALLKIDVERAELDVLRGVAPADWRNIRAVAAEVHDYDGRLAEVLALLRTHGFDVTSEQPASLKDSNLHMVYATRSLAEMDT